MFKRWLTILAILMCPFPNALAENTNPLAMSEPDGIAIRAVITAQLAAFQHDDAELAFSFATFEIQDRFGNADTFLAMVKTAYPAVYRPRDVQFRDLKMGAEGMVQDVFLVGPNGLPVLGHYLMKRMSDGSWRTNGCEVTPAPDLAI